MDSKRDVILAYLKTRGPATLADIAAYLVAGRRACTGSRRPPASTSRTAIAS